MKNFAAIGVAVMLGIIAVLAVSQYVSSIKAEAEAENMEVVAVGRSITRGDKIKSDDLVKKTTKRDPSAVPWEEHMAVVGQTAAIDIKADTALTRSMFSETEKRFSKDLLKPGQRAVTIEVGSDSGFAGMLVPGDLIDILITYQPTPAMQASLTNPNGSDGGGVKAGAAATKLLITGWMMQGVQIVALDNRTTMGAYNATSSDYNLKQYGTITIAVSTQQAQMLTFARQSAGVKMTFVLRNPDDHNAVENVNDMDYNWFTKLLKDAAGGPGH